MERHVLEKLLAGDEEASAAALAALRSGATYSVWDTTHPAEQHAGVFARRLRRMRLHGVEPLGLERMVRLLREHGQPVRGGLIDSADQKWTFLFYFTETAAHWWPALACSGGSSDHRFRSEVGRLAV